MKKYLFSLIVFFITINSANAQWAQITLPTQYGIAQMQFVNDSVGYIIADSIVGLSLAGKVYKTTDRGLNWVEKNFYYQSFNYIHFINADTGWIAMSDGGIGAIRRTSDGGNTWFNISFNAPHGPMYFVSSSVGYIGWVGVGPNGAVLYKTIDGGVTWTSTGINLGISGLQDLLFENSTTGYLGGLYGPTLGKIDITNQSYNTFSTNIAVFDMDYEPVGNQLFFTGEQFGVNAGLYKTTSGGSPINFFNDNDLINAGAYSVKCKNANEIICGGYQGNVALSSDGGNSWTIENTGSQTSFTDVYWGSDFAIAAGGDGELYRRSFPVSLSENHGEEVISMYPNPAENTLHIESESNEETGLVIYNILQQKLIEHKLNKGNNFSIDISSLPAALYMVVFINRNNKIIDVKRLMVK